MRPSDIRLLTTFVLLTTFPARSEQIVINEIMYHPSSENPKEEYIELFNAGSLSVSLQGWRFTAGIGFTFPDVTISPGAYLVVAADLPTFQTKNPSVPNVVGGWRGTLSHGGEKIELENANGGREDSVEYANEGDWAVRTRGPLDHNHQGWIWLAEHNGSGKSLELVNPALSNKQGQNWAPSIPSGGTPGKENSRFLTNIPPMILQASHSPLIPKSTESVNVTARIEDEYATALSVRVHYRVDGSQSFITEEMFDDGLHGDDLAADGFYGAILPPQPDNTIVEFYLEASDLEGNRRTWPDPTQPAGTQSANLLYQVRDAAYAGDQPLYLLIMTKTEEQELAYLGDTLPDALSNAQMNGTFISLDEAGINLRYTVGIRNRGHGSRASRPNNYRVDFKKDSPWKGVHALNLNSQYGYVELVGIALFRKAGFPVQDGHAAQVRVNNVNLAKSGAPQFGSYSAVEALDSDFVDRHFPYDSSGNLYRGIASDPPLKAEADLYYRGSDPDAYKTNYFKETNKSANDWSDLMELTQVLSDTKSAIYGQDIDRVLHIHEWIRYFALNTLMDNNETGIYNGFGDDYALYRGVNDRRFYIVPYDLDTVLGQGDQPGKPKADIFRATALFVVNRFLRGADFLPLYYAHLRGLMDTLLSPDQLNPLLDEVLGSFVPQATIGQMKAFAADRNQFVRSLLPPVVQITQEWKYDQSGADWGTAWREAGFDDTRWRSGQGLLYSEHDPLPAPKKTQLTLGKTTYYFRTHFSLPGGLAPHLSPMKLVSSMVVDDGAVFYLNGVELFRLGMTEGPVSSSTLASREVFNAVYDGPFTLPAHNLAAGDNVLAVEVHQIDPTSSDVVFGMTLDLSIPSLEVIDPPSPIVINEVLANSGKAGVDNFSRKDWIELYNLSGRDLDLSDASLSTSRDTPRQWVFPPGSIIPALDYMVVNFDPDAPVSSSNTGFGLKSTGDEVYLFDNSSNGGRLLDSIRFGFQASGFSIGRIPNGVGTNWVLNLPSAGSENSAASPGDSSALKINEWLADPIEGNDWFEIYNPTRNPVDLGSFYLTDNLSLPRQSKIPALSFVGVGADAYQKFIADSNSSKGANHTSFKLSSGGDSIALFTPAGALVDRVDFGPQQAGVSQGRFPDGSGAVVNFALPTSSGSNFSALTNVVINEVLTHTDPPLEDAIELYNPTASPVDIGGWFLSDSAQHLRKFRIPEGTTIPAGGFQVFYEYQFNPDTNVSTSFSLSSVHGNEVWLSETDVSGDLTGRGTRATFGPAENGVSFGRYLTSQGADFVAMESRSFGVDDPSTLEAFRSGRGLPNSRPRLGPVVINELMYHPNTAAGNASIEQTEFEFLELRNISEHPVLLFDPDYPTNTWQLRGGIDFIFPENLILSAGGVLVVVDFDPVKAGTALGSFQTRYGVPSGAMIFGPYLGKLSNSGDRIELYKPGPPQAPGLPDAGFVPYVSVERITYSDQAPWPPAADGTGMSLQRANPVSYGNDPASWLAAAPTPGQGPSSTTPEDGRLHIGFQPGKTAFLRFEAVAGKTYILQFRESLDKGEWSNLKSIFPSTTGTIEVLDPVPAGTISRIYRLVLPGSL